MVTIYLICGYLSLLAPRGRDLTISYVLQVELYYGTVESFVLRSITFSFNKFNFVSRNNLIVTSSLNVNLKWCYLNFSEWIQSRSVKTFKLWLKILYVPGQRYGNSLMLRCSTYVPGVELKRWVNRHIIGILDYFRSCKRSEGCMRTLREVVFSLCLLALGWT